MITVKNKDYRLKLNMRGCVNLERKLGTNPANVIMSLARNEMAMPNMEEMLLIIHEALQPFNHGIDLDKTYELIDSWFEEGHDMGEFIQIIVDVLQGSGLLPKEVDEDKEVKNA